MQQIVTLSELTTRQMVYDEDILAQLQTGAEAVIAEHEPLNDGEAWARIYCTA